MRCSSDLCSNKVVLVKEMRHFGGFSQSDAKLDMNFDSVLIVVNKYAATGSSWLAQNNMAMSNRNKNGLKSQAGVNVLFCLVFLHELSLNFNLPQQLNAIAIKSDGPLCFQQGDVGFF